MLKSDLHLHTQEDKLDSHIPYTAKELIIYASKLDYEVLSLTHHSARFFSSELKSYAKKHNILLIPGTEAKIQGREVLLINFPNQKQPTTFEEIEKLRHENVVVIAPHPFFPRKDCLRNMLIKHIDLFDGIEYCHFYLPWLNLNRKAARVAKKHNLPLIGTSDAHRLYQMNTTFTLLDAEKNTDSVLEAIRKSRTTLITQPISPRNFVRITALAVFYPPK